MSSGRPEHTGAAPPSTSSTPSGPAHVERVGVVVPARDEERLLPECLEAVAAAARAVPAHVDVRVVVVADGCTDDTARVARTHAVEVLEVPAGNVGSARQAGCALLLHEWRAADPVRLRRSWLAHTDADSRVPRDWLSVQLDLAALGEDVVAGVVDLDAAAEPSVAARWRETYATGLQTVPWPEHHHVHGANLGVRADWHVRVGGVPPLATGEDRALVRALRRSGARITAVRHTPVVTSSRLAGRAPGGVSHDLSTHTGSR